MVCVSGPPSWKEEISNDLPNAGHFLSKNKIKRRAWFLAWPRLNAERKFDSGLRISAGIGVFIGMGADEVLPFLPFEGGYDIPDFGYHPDRYEWTENGLVENKNRYNNFETSCWNTISMDFTYPLSERMALQCTLAKVAKGLNFKHAEWVGVDNLVILGLTYRL